MLKKVKSIKAENCNMEATMEKMANLEKKFKHAARMVHLKTKSAGKYIAKNKELNKQILTMKAKKKEAQNSFNILMLELEEKHTQNFVTRVDGHKFTSDVEKCVMELVGECDVPTSKCGQIIQTVSKLHKVYDLSLKDLPCSNTAVNMMDRACVLSTYQITEQMMSASAWNMHCDGTSRDHKKILGHQV